MSGITKQQIIQIRTIINKLGLDEDKDNIILQASEERTSKTSELTGDEAAQLIVKLRAAMETEGDKANKMRRKVISCCYEMRMFNHKGFIDMRQVNAIVAEKGYLKEKGKLELNDYTAAELPTLITQFERIRDHFLKKRSNGTT